MSKRTRIASWTLQVIAAVILIQTLAFKFTGATESVYIFSQLGAEPWGRIGSGVIELIAALLLLAPRTVLLGALLAIGTMAGALLAHLTRLGITLPAVGDRGELFTLGVVVLVAAASILALRRDELVGVVRHLVTRRTALQGGGR